jgi:hypothetical protein
MKSDERSSFLFSRLLFRSYLFLTVLIALFAVEAWLALSTDILHVPTGHRGLDPFMVTFLRYSRAEVGTVLLLCGVAWLFVTVPALACPDRCTPYFRFFAAILIFSHLVLILWVAGPLRSGPERIM